MRTSLGELLQLRAYMRASRELNGWIAGARALALLAGAAESGLLDALQASSTPQQLAGATGLSEKRLRDLCLALEAHGVVRQNGDAYALAPDFALLASPTAPVPLSSVIRQAMVMTRTLQSCASPESDATYTALPSEDVLAMAEGAGISAVSAAPHVTPETMGKNLPEVEALWQAGVRHLEVGCGVGNSLLGVAMMYPKVAATGIEIDEQTAAEAGRRAKLLGVADRVELRRMDACELQDVDSFDTIQWSQFFFPAASRPVVLQAMRRALKPGGYLFMPWLGSASGGAAPHRTEMLEVALRSVRSGGFSFLAFLNDAIADTPERRIRERRFAALQNLIFERWGIPVRTVEELESELRENDFEVVRVLHTPVSQFALTRGFVLAQMTPRRAS